MKKPWVVAAVAVGCGPAPSGSTSENTTSSSTDTDGDIESLAAEISDAICSKREACECPESSPRPGQPCRDVYQERYQALFRNSAYGFDRNCFNERIAAIKALRCDERESSALDWEQRSCRLFQPLESAECSTPWLGSWSCAGDEWCAACEPGPIGGCLGWCVDAPTLSSKGMDCRYYEQSGRPFCESGLVCDLGGKCRAGAVIGAACPMQSETGAVPCAQGYCDCDGAPCDLLQGDPLSGICRDFLAPGEDCESSEQCEFDCGNGSCQGSKPLVCDDLNFESF